MAEPSSEQMALAELLWPVDRLGQALYALARSAGLPVTHVEESEPPVSLTGPELTAWVEAAAAVRDVQASPAAVPLADVESLVSTAAPLLLATDTSSGPAFLAIADVRRGKASVIAPDLRRHRVRLAAVVERVRRPFEGQVAGGIDEAVNRMPISARARTRVRKALVDGRVGAQQFHGAYLIRLPVGSAIAAEARQMGFPARVGALILAHISYYVLFLASWWVLGRGLLDGSIERGWLWGWVLLLLTLVPLRLLTMWWQGTITISGCAWLRQRMLRGALRIDRGELRRAGPGQFFGLTVEAAALESMGLSGGVMAMLGLLELAVTAVVLFIGAGAVPAALLVGWTGAVLAVAWVYLRRRATWTRKRVTMTDQLVQAMIGYRTRLAQQPESQRHAHEDESLHEYTESSRAMDRVYVWLAGAVSRGWLVIAVVGVLPMTVSAATPAEVAMTVGAVLLGYRALRRLASGLSALTGAAVAGHVVLPLVRAAADADLPTPPIFAIRKPRDASRGDAAFVQARDIVHRYRAGDEPVLSGCSLTVGDGTRLLLEGASGSGKTTFASILAGLETPDSGLVLLNGLDRSVLRTAGWRSRVVLVPQPQDNYLLGATLAFNLLCGRQWPPRRADLVEAEQICRELGLGPLLERMPGGLQQIVGETGWQLSQGERARVFIARALLQKPDLLVLDESWGPLDPENAECAIRCITARAGAVIAIAHA
jgi:ATP-binding cassette, subfamily B, bacterial